MRGPERIAAQLVVRIRAGVLARQGDDRESEDRRAGHGVTHCPFPL
jgi:hypothetical protein